MTDRASSPSRSLVVVTAGLGVPSSTRLLADRLAAATERHLADAGIDARVEVVELRDHAQDLTNHLLTGFPSPKLQAVIDAVIASAFRSTGQSCSLGSRLFVQRPIYESFLDRIATRARAIRIGMPLDRTTHIGPQTSAEQQCTDNQDHGERDLHHDQAATHGEALG